uniref:DUF5641 domain-containing protein n=1 Tax=Steinernema glaseri TaxID=37863 RepID=A0A1I7ZUE2_9BILA
MTEENRISTFMANQEALWRKITPYSPWQGGFYERLIRGIKGSLYKAIGKKRLSYEDLGTLLIEIEATLNSRPMTYIEEKWETKPILRPIDFLQNDITVAYPLENHSSQEADDDYFPPSDAAILRTRMQTWEALKSSIEANERFWKIWREDYLTQLREHHKKRMDSHRSATNPKIGDVVLLVDNNQPRNQWDIGRITKIAPSHDDEIREVIVKKAGYGDEFRRPVNLLVPLEVTDDPKEHDDKEKPKDPKPPAAATSQKKPTENQRILRPKKKVNYADAFPIIDSPSVPFRKPTSYWNFLFLLTTLLTCFGSTKAVDTFAAVHCIKGGLRLTTVNVEEYEICTGTYCSLRSKPTTEEVYWVPPEVSITRYPVTFKAKLKNRIVTSETTCEAEPFCENIRCTFCTSLIFNPTAVAVLALIIYASTVVTYLALKIVRTRSMDEENKITTFMANHEISWRKITPYSPWQGGDSSEGSSTPSTRPLGERG